MLYRVTNHSSSPKALKGVDRRPRVVAADATEELDLLPLDPYTIEKLAALELVIELVDPEAAAVTLAASIEAATAPVDPVTPVDPAPPTEEAKVTVVTPAPVPATDPVVPADWQKGLAGAK